MPTWGIHSMTWAMPFRLKVVFASGPWGLPPTWRETNCQGMGKAPAAATLERAGLEAKSEQPKPTEIPRCWVRKETKMKGGIGVFLGQLA